MAVKTKLVYFENVFKCLKMIRMPTTAPKLTNQVTNVARPCFLTIIILYITLKTNITAIHVLQHAKHLPMIHKDI